MKTLFSKVPMAQKLLIVLCLLFVGAGHMKAAYEYGKYNLYLDISQNTGWKVDNGYIGFHFSYNENSNGEYIGRYKATLVEGNIYCVSASTHNNAYIRGIKAARWAISDDGNTDYNWNIAGNTHPTSSSSHSSKNCIKIPSNGWSGCTVSWDAYIPTVSSVALSFNVVPSSGSGTSGDPYIVPTDTTVRVTATPTSVIDDSQMTMKYQWDSGSWGTTKYKDLSCSTNNTTYSTTVTCKNEFNSNKGNGASATVYFKAVSTPTLSLSAPSTAVRGDAITLTATPSNATTPTIYYEYSTSSTFASSVTEINHTTSTSQSWTVPTGTSGTTYYLRAKMQVSSTWYYSSILTLTAYGKKTIKVKNTNNWATMKLYLYSASAEKEAWPGSTTGITSAGGQWKTVVLTSEWPYFILTDGTNQIKGDQNYSYASSVTDGNCYAISSGTGDQLTLSSATCPSAPTSVTTTATPTSVTNAQMTLNGNIGGNGNDNITDYGFYYGTTNACGTQAQIGTSNKTGDISKRITSLTAGTTYYFKAYATNGQGTSYGDVESYKLPYKVTVSTNTGCSEITNSGTNYTNSTITVTATKTTGYTFSSWSTTNGTQTSTSSTSTTNTLTFTPTSDNATISPTYTENKTSITISAGSNGSISTPSPNKSPYSLGVATKQAIVASPNDNYAFVEWALTGTAAVDNASNKSTNAKGNGTSGGTGTITATFAPRWTLKGGDSGSSNGSDAMGDWGTFNDLTGTTTALKCTLSLAANTTYQFKIFDRRSTNDWYGNNSAFVGQTTGLTMSTSEDNCHITTAGAGNYIFTFNANTKALTVTYPTVTHPCGDYVYFKKPDAWGGVKGYVYNSEVVAWAASPNLSTMTFDSKTYYYAALGGNTAIIFYNSSDDSQKTGNLTTASSNKGKYYDQTLGTPAWLPFKVTITLNQKGATTNSNPTSYNPVYNSDVLAALTSNPVKTGYTFGGFYTGDGSGSQIIGTDKAWKQVSEYTDASKHWIRRSSATLYAKWTPKTSALSFNYQTSDPGYKTSGTISAASSATYDAAMPALSGNVPTAKDGYAFMGFYDGTGDGAKKYYNADKSSAVTKWDKNTTSGTTLYAHYQKSEITGITLSAGSVVAPSTSTTATATLSPTPAGTTHIDWKIRYSNDNPLADQPSFGTGTTTASFTTPEASGTYKLEAVLRTGSTANAGTTIDSLVQSFQVAGSHTVTVMYKDTSKNSIKESVSLEGIKPLEWSEEITPPEIFGYTFKRWSAGDGVTLTADNGATTNTDTTVARIKIKAVYDGYLTATYTPNQIIYFKNTLGWNSVYVNLYSSSYWDNPHGSGNENVTNRNIAMTRIGETDVWYYDYGAASITPSLYVSFTSASQDNKQYFWAANPGVNVVYPANYPNDIHTDKSSENGFKAATPMFVPLATQSAVVLNSANSGKANYYNAGYWTKYLPGTGYTLEIYNSEGNVLLKSIEFTSEDELMPMKVVTDLEAGTTYKYQLRRGGTSSAGIYYGNSGTMTYDNHGAGTAWEMINTMDGGFKKAGITTNAAGDYIFNLSYAGNSSTPPQYRLRMAVDYPVAVGDYRLLYKDNTQTKWFKSAIIPRDKAKDTVSFFVRKGQSAVLKLQKCSGLSGSASWTDTVANWWSTFPTAVTKDSVYNICLKHNASTGKLEIENVEAYTGNYYIRTDAANSKWDNYRSDPDHLMTYSEYSIEHGGYSHYYTHWVKTDDRKNIKFCIANDYSPSISDTLIRETASGTWQYVGDFIDANGDIKRNANVRFMWNRHDNTISRAYIDGAQEDGSLFLTMLSSDSKVLNPSTSAVQATTTFNDNGNWIYEADIKAIPGAAIKLKSSWGKSGETAHIIDQYFKGGISSTEELIGGSSASPYDIRLLYDFKTNRLVAAWIPSGEIGTETSINADVMFIREHQGDIAQLTFTGSGAIKKIETAYGVLRLNKWTLNNKDMSTHLPLAKLLSRYERDLFYISFPFRVSMEEVFGFGKYGQHWIIEEYDGANRAKEGFWQESDPNWKFIFNRKGKFFEPGQGYIIALDLDELRESSTVWANTEQVELYFPSYGDMSTITSSSVTYEIPEHTCTINRSKEKDASGNELGSDYDRRVKDSHWNVLGVPTYVNTSSLSFANTDWITKVDTLHLGPNFLYAWNPDDNTVTAVSGVGYTYHAMHAYLVQYCGNVTWTSSVSPTAAPRRNPAYRGEYEFRLEMLQNDEAVDQTYVKLMDNEAVTTGFEFNYDLSKEFNKNKANIYTLIGTEQAAGNCLPLTDQTTVVPVGVKIAENGEYIFSMPDGTDGIGVTLIDNERGTRTSLSAVDYAVTLEAGTYNERFVLEISPIQQVVTNVEAINGENGDATLNGVCKKLIDGVLYIIKDGKVFDARGARVQ